MAFRSYSRLKTGEGLTTVTGFTREHGILA